MRLNTKHIRVLLPLAILLLTAGAFAAAPRIWEKIVGKPVKERKRIVITQNNKQEKTIISELTKVLHTMDTVTVITVTGTLEGHDFADSTNDMQSEFYYMRQGDQGYYKLGSNEMVSLKDAYIVVAHDMKKIFVAEPKQVVNPLGISPSMEAEFLSRESYKVSRASDGQLTRISLVNAKHASCREYRVSFDNTGVIWNAVMRMPDPGGLEDMSRDKLLKVTIRSWEAGVVRKDLLRIDRYFVEVNGKIVPAARLKGYELVKQ